MSMSITPGFPAGFQAAFYAVAALPILLGAALIIAGIVIVVKYRNREP